MTPDELQETVARLRRQGTDDAQATFPATFGRA